MYFIDQKSLFYKLYNYVKIHVSVYSDRLPTCFFKSLFRAKAKQNTLKTNKNENLVQFSLVFWVRFGLTKFGLVWFGSN